MSAQPTPDDTDTIELIDALAEIREAHGVSVTYQTLWGACVGGTVRARRVRRRWHLWRADLPRVAAILAGARPPARAKLAEPFTAAA